jgi:hypothetical protein
MTSRELVLNTLKRYGKQVAQELQKKAPEMTGSELYEETDFIPKFNPERQYLNFEVGYICKSTAGRVVKLLQPYDSTVYTAEPEELPAQWGFYWSTEPAKALPFVSLATSPYNTGDCCTENDVVYRSTIDNNTWQPSEYPAGWEVVTV